MGYYSSHLFAKNGAITTVERIGDNELSIRVQGADEEMLTDIIIADFEALCLAHSILSILTFLEE